jgi:hypothetical protein
VDEQYIRQIPLTALFASLGIVLPQFFHLIGLGSIFLPMFLPVMMGSMLLTWRFALALAVICPVVSWAITGMPPVAPPVLPVILAELTVLSLTISIIHVHLRKSFWLALSVGILTDRATLLILVYLLTPLFGLEHPLFSLALVTAGFPGIVLQLITIPLAMVLIRQRFPQLVNR